VYHIQLAPNGWDQTVLTDLGAPDACADFLARESIAVEVTKKGRLVALDARPLIQEFRDVGQIGTPAWQLTLRVGPGGSVKPAVVMRRFLEQRVPSGRLEHMVSSLRVRRTALALEGQG
jgi:hypothetical protein